MTTPKRGPGRPATGHTPVRSIRVDSDTWDPFVEAAGKNHVEVIKKFLAWYARLPGAKFPKRPAPPETTD